MEVSSGTDIAQIELMVRLQKAEEALAKMKIKRDQN